MLTKPQSESSETESSTSTESRTTAVETVTAGGTVRTVTIGPAPTSADPDGADGEVVNTDGGDGGLSKGALAGIIVGAILAVLGAVGLGLWLFFRRRKRHEQEVGYEDDPSIRGSSSGMMGSGQPPEMAQGAATPGSPNSNSNRNSTLLIDPRMDPFKQGLYVRSASHESVNTIRDDRDYSRRILRATNPDPETDAQR